MHALEYDKIRQRLAGYCVNDGAKETALALEPESDRSEIARQLGFTDEALEMSLRSGRMPMSKPCGSRRESAPIMRDRRMLPTLSFTGSSHGTHFSCTRRHFMPR